MKILKFSTHFNFNNMRTLIGLIFIQGLFGLCVGQNPTDYHIGNTGIISDHEYVLDYLEINHPGFKNAYNKTFDKLIISHHYSVLS